MAKILKYQLKHAYEQIVHIPRDREILKCDVQHHTDGDKTIQMWCLVDVESPMEPMKIMMLETSKHEVDVDISQHISTIFYHGVYHIFHVD